MKRECPGAVVPAQEVVDIAPNMSGHKCVFSSER